MFRNYLKVALRNSLKNKLISFMEDANICHLPGGTHMLSLKTAWNVILKPIKVVEKVIKVELKPAPIVSIMLAAWSKVGVHCISLRVMHNCEIHAHVKGNANCKAVKGAKFFQSTLKSTWTKPGAAWLGHSAAFETGVIKNPNQMS